MDAARITTFASARTAQLPGRGPEDMIGRIDSREWDVAAGVPSSRGAA